jgi:hypothetical protein
MLVLEMASVMLWWRFHTDLLLGLSWCFFVLTLITWAASVAVQYANRHPKIVASAPEEEFLFEPLDIPLVEHTPTLGIREIRND